MPLDYTGDDTATQAPSVLPAKSATPIFRLPVDGEALNVASIYQPFKAAADGLDFVFDRTGVLDSANTWSALQTFNGASGDTNGTRQTTEQPTNRKLIDSWKLTATIWARVYSTPTGFEHTINAAWDGANWDADDAAQGASRWRSAIGAVYGEFKTAAATWADGAWVEGWRTDESNGALSSSATVNSPVIIAGTKFRADTARSSATPGAGQSVAAGEVWKDTAVHAWGVFEVTAAPGVSFVRGANISSVQYQAAGIYKVTLQSAGTNVLCISPSVEFGSTKHAFIDTSVASPTTSVFYIGVSSAAHTLEDNTGLRVHFTVKQG